MGKGGILKMESATQKILDKKEKEFRLECEKAVKNLEDTDFGRNIQGVIELLKLLRLEK